MNISLNRVIVAKDLIEKDINTAGYPQIMLELGCGDGKFAYNYAKLHPQAFIIATDADKFQLQEVSRKAAGKIVKGGLSNLIYVWAAAENLPMGLTGAVDLVQVNFPWGKLLKGLLVGLDDVLAAMANCLKSGGEFVIYTTYANDFEPETVAELGLPDLVDLQSLIVKLQPIYATYNLTISEISYIEDQAVVPNTSWWKRIGSKRDRKVVRIKGRKATL